MPHCKKKRAPCSIDVCKRAELYCETCKRDVYAICMTKQWHDHLTHSIFSQYVGKYRQVYSCPYCGNYVGCVACTYTPVSDRIPTTALRLGRKLTYDMVRHIGEEFDIKRVEIANCLGFKQAPDIKRCDDVDRLRQAYLFGAKLRNELAKIAKEKNGGM